MRFFQIALFILFLVLCSFIVDVNIYIAGSIISMFILVLCGLFNSGRYVSALDIDEDLTYTAFELELMAEAENEVVIYTEDETVFDMYEAMQELWHSDPAEYQRSCRLYAERCANARKQAADHIEVVDLTDEAVFEGMSYENVVSIERPYIIDDEDSDSAMYAMEFGATELCPVIDMWAC